MVSTRTKQDGKRKPDDMDTSGSASSTQPDLVAEQGGAAQESLSIEETNKLREKLGLKPLGVSATSDDTPGEEKKDEFVHAPAVNLGQKKKTEALAEKLATKKETRKHETKLQKVKTLAEEEEDDDNISDWVRKSRQLEKDKQLVLEREKAFRELEEQFGVGQLIDQEKKSSKKSKQSGDHLDGLAVEHDVKEFKAGRTTELTLKDSGILDKDYEDVLVNANLIDDARAKQNIKNKTQSIKYNPYENADDINMVYGQPTDILEKYDAVVNDKAFDHTGAKKSRFTLSKGQYDASHERAVERMETEAKSNRQSLEMPQLRPATDYYTPQELEGFKKKKRRVKNLRNTKSKKSDGVLHADDLLVMDAQKKASSSSSKPKSKKPKLTEDEASVQDDVDEDSDADFEKLDREALMRVCQEEEVVTAELEAALSRHRKMVQASTSAATESHNTPSDSAEHIPNSVPSHLKTEVQDIIRLRGVKEEPVVVEMDEAQISRGSAKSKFEPLVLNETSEFCRALPTASTLRKARDDSDDELPPDADGTIETTDAMEEDAAIGVIDADGELVHYDKPGDDNDNSDDDLPIRKEPAVRSMAGTLAFLTQRGVAKDVQPPGARQYLPDGRETTVTVHAAKQYQVDHTRGDSDGRSIRREVNGRLRDFEELRDYKPKVDLTYVDEKGNVLTSKDAYREASYRFHGRAPCKKKQEQRARAAEQQKAVAFMPASDTPLNTRQRMIDKQMSTQLPYVPISGGKNSTQLTQLSKNL